MAEPTAITKTCAMCGDDVSAKPRTKDARGRYFCKACYEKALAQHKVGGTATASQATAIPVDDGVYGLEARASPAPRPMTVTPAQRTAPVATPSPRPSSPASLSSPKQIATPALRHAGPEVCPSCDQSLAPGTLICVPCGINVQTGRSILTAEQGDTEKMYEHARGIFWFVSWILLIGLLPFSSEAHGSYKPWALRSLAIVTVFTSMWVWWYEWTGSPQMRHLKNLMMWVGDQEPDAERIEGFYEMTAYGDRKAFNQKKYELRNTVPDPDLALAAHRELPKSKQAFGEFHWWQLLTCAFLHGGFLHLGTNLLFMLVFGSRINALIGNAATLLLYPLLAIGSSLPDLWFMSDQQPTPTLGASGAIMGLAGMYFVLFPVCKVHVAAFIRLPILLLGFFRCRGFWILLVYVGMDVISTIMQAEDGVAHWAHMGGFAVGTLIATVLLVTRGVNARGNDLISVLLGRHAWSLIGKPSQWRTAPDGEGWMTRWRLLPAFVTAPAR